MTCSLEGQPMDSRPFGEESAFCHKKLVLTVKPDNDLLISLRRFLKEEMRELIAEY
jgi:hypothetical protein